MIAILPFAHFFGAALAYYLLPKKYQNIVTMLLMGILGIAPDVDILFGYIPGMTTLWHGLLVHRNLTHTIIPAIVIGFFTLYYFQSYAAGFLAYFSHFILDTLDNGGVAILPWIKVDIIPDLWSGLHQQVIFSSIFGTVFMFIILYVEWRRLYGTRSNPDAPEYGRADSV